MPNWKKVITSGSDASLNSLNLSSIVNANTDTDKFLVLDSVGNVDFRTGAEVLSDIGGQGNSPGIVSSSVQIQAYDIFLEKLGDNVISSSAQLNNATISGLKITSGQFTGSAKVDGTLTIGSQIFYPQGNNGFSVNENFDPSNNSLQTAYHFTSGVGRETVAFTLARTGQFTDGFGIYGTSADNTFVMFGEQSNTKFEWRTGVGIQPLDLDGGTLLASIDANGAISASIFSGSFVGDGSQITNVTAEWDGTHNGNAEITGSLIVSGALTASSLQVANIDYPTTDATYEYQFLQSDASGSLTFADVTTLYDTIVNGELIQLDKGTPVYVSGAQGANPVVYRADAYDPSKMPVIYIISEAIAAGGVGRGITLGTIDGIDLTGIPVGTDVYVGASGSWVITKPTGSAIIQPLGLVKKTGTGGKGLVLNPGPSTLPNINQSNIWIGASTHYPTEISYSLDTLTSYGNTTTNSISVGAVTASSFTGSFVGDGSGLTNVTAEWDGSHLGDASITGSTYLSGSSTPLTVFGRIGIEDLGTSTFIGKNAGVLPQGATKYNTAIGTDTLSTITSAATFNTAVGGHAGRLITSGQSNTAVGGYSLRNLTTGIGNTALGALSMNLATLADYNTAVGNNSLSSLIDGTQNTAVGVSALNLTTGDDNTALGHGAGTGITSGYNNIAVGSNSAITISTGYNNVVVGMNQTITTGHDNIVLGHNQNLGITTGDYNTIVGGAITGLGANLNNNIILADGQGNIQLQINSNSTASFAGRVNATSFAGDGSQLTGITTDTGSLLLSASASPNTITFTKGDGSTFDINPTTGSFTGSFEGHINNVLIHSGSGFTSYYRTHNVTTVTITDTVALVPVSSDIDGVFFDYVIRNGAGTSKRVGTVYAVNANPPEYSDVSTLDIGDTSDVRLAVEYASGNLYLRAYSSSTGWQIKSLTRTL